MYPCVCPEMISDNPKLSMLMGHGRDVNHKPRQVICMEVLLLDNEEYSLLFHSFHFSHPRCDFHPLYTHQLLHVLFSVAWLELVNMTYIFKKLMSFW